MATDATASVTPGSGSALTFYGLSSRASQNRFALQSSNGFPEYEYSVWHIPGTDGNVVCNMGETGRMVTIYALYYGAYNTALRLYEADKAAMAGVPCTVVDCAGYTHTRCRLKTSKDTSPPRGLQAGASLVVFFTAEFTFEVHGTSSAPAVPPP